MILLSQEWTSQCQPEYGQNIAKEGCGLLGLELESRWWVPSKKLHLPTPLIIQEKFF